MADVTITLDVPTLTMQVYGQGQTWEFDGGDDGGLGGLFDMAAKMSDTTRNLGDGDVTSPHYAGSTLLSLPLILSVADTPSDALDAVEALRDAWAPIEGTDDADLATLTIDIWGHTYAFLGKPISRKFKLGQLKSAYASALCTFKVYGEAPGS